jgi:hypothetical protein
MVVGFATTFGAAAQDRHTNLRVWTVRVRARAAGAREFDALGAAAATV